jgi:hypothetical protein
MPSLHRAFLAFALLAIALAVAPSWPPAALAMREGAGMGLQKPRGGGGSSTVVVASIQPDFMPADGLANAVIGGAWTGSVTAVTVGGVSATIVSQAANTVTVTIPAGTASATALDVAVTASGSTGKLTGGFWYLPAGAYYQWDAYNRASLTLSGALVTAISDSSNNGYNGAQATTANQLTYVSSVASLNNRPALQGSGGQFLQGASLSVALSSPATHIAVVSITGAIATNHDQIVLDGIDATHRLTAAIGGSDEGANDGWIIYAGSASSSYSVFTDVIPSLNTPYCNITVFGTSFGTSHVFIGSTQLGNSGTSGTYTATSSVGITWGARFAAAGGVGYGLIGYTALAMSYPRALSTSDIAIVASVMNQVFGSAS